jgi:[protein-PII] uridylyltransferase
MQQEKAILDESTLIEMRRQHALQLLVEEGIAPAIIHDLWTSFKGKYFLHESPEIIARHTKAILNSIQFPLVLIMPHHTQAGTEVFIYMPHRDDRFTITTTVLSNHHVTIQEANILTNDNDFDLDTYIILDEKNQAFFDERRNQSIGQALVKHLTNPQLPSISLRRLSRTQAHFNLPPKVTYTEDSQQPYTCLFLVAVDRWGLLASIGRIFLKEKIYLHHAKIATAGERAEDMFFISNQEGKKLSMDEKEQLRHAIIQTLLH